MQVQEKNVSILTAMPPQEVPQKAEAFPMANEISAFTSFFNAVLGAGASAIAGMANAFKPQQAAV